MRVWSLGAAIALLGCGASSPYDRAWVGREIQASAGHAMGDPTRPPSLPKGVDGVGALSEETAVAVTLWNSPALGAELATLGASQADLEEAGELANPTFSLLFPIGPRQVEMSVLAPLSSLVQRPFRVKAAKLDVERVARGLVQRGLDVARDARLAWIDAEAAKARAKTHADLAEAWGRIAKIATARLSAGDAAAIEAAAAEADARDALDRSARAATEQATAVARLRLVLGLADGPLGAGISTASSTVDERPPGEEEALVARALAARPDVRAAEIAIEAATSRRGWEKSRVFALMARLDAKPIGSQGGSPVLPVPGLQAEIPIFNWNRGGVGRAEAEVAAAALRYRLLRQTIVTDVRVGCLALTQALASLQRYRGAVLPLLQKAADTARMSFETGDQSYLVTLEATRRLSDARLRLIDLEAEVRRARAHLERHIGRREHVR